VNYTEEEVKSHNFILSHLIRAYVEMSVLEAVAFGWETTKREMDLVICAEPQGCSRSRLNTRDAS
jgi:hypothetical protein